MAEVFEDEQEKSASATEIEHTLGCRAMEFQILHAFPIQSQPRLDICIFGISCSGVCISLLDLAGAFAIDLRQHWLKRHTENGSLRPAPAAPVAQRLCKLENLAGKLHLWRRQSCLRARLTQVRRTNGFALTRGALKSQTRLSASRFYDFAEKSRAAIHKSGINLNELRARLKFLQPGFSIANSARSDHRNCGLCNNIAHQRGGLFAQGCAAQAAFLIELRRN